MTIKDESGVRISGSITNEAIEQLGLKESGSHHQANQRNGCRRLIPNTASFTRRAPKAPSWFYYAARALWPG
ncbi:MAG: hypothetical protein U0L69_00950 [Eggerthellaceae bacterium]|nr:hypothetical protein [Eggerthellaceae bacterium]